MKKVQGTQIEQIIKVYLQNNSILETARECELSTVKVRKILITEGLWESDTSLKIGELLKKGYTTEEIANKLYMSVKNVQAYMPYERGSYGGDLSAEAVRSQKYRRRMRKAASMQVVKKQEKREREEENIMQVKDNRSAVLKLNLELNTRYLREEEIQILKKYGDMKQTISREVLVPEDITLHALNYAILRMFGWQNSHLHNFSLPEDVFNKLTENRFATWAKLAGVYFRYPTEDYEDIYWDDDYKEGESFRTWLKKKYTGPYRYKGFREHYLINQLDVRDLYSFREEITVRKFDIQVKEPVKPYKVKIKEASVDEVINAFADMTCNELLERLPLAEVMHVKNKEINYKDIRKKILSKTAEVDIERIMQEYHNSRFKSLKQRREFFEKYNKSVQPIADELIYSYDYGDGWEVLIQCENVYKKNEVGNWIDNEGKVVEKEIEQMEEVLLKHRPVCIAKDGIELVDDVGGIYGFCNMLQTIYEADIYDEEEKDERDSMISWANMMGWTGRKISPKQTL